MFSKEQLQWVLDPDETKTNAPWQTSHSHAGPGQFDAWLPVFGKDDAWVQVQAAQNRKNRKKIIFAYPFLAEMAPSEEELSIFSLLLRHGYELYLWPGTKTPFKSTPRITTSGHFWQKRGEAIAATKQEIEKTLAQQGFAANEYLILDHENYGELIRRNFHAKEVLGNYSTPPRFYAKKNELDLQYINLLDIAVFEKLHQSVNPTIIDTLTLKKPSLKEIQLIREKFPSVKKLILSDITQEWIEKNRFFDMASLEVTLKGFKSKNLTIPEDVSLESLIINNALQLKTLNIKTPTLNALAIIKSNKIKCVKIPENNHIKKLETDNKTILSQIGQLLPLTELIVTNISDNVINNEIKIINSTLEKLQLKEIDGFSIPAEIVDITACENLSTIHLHQADVKIQGSENTPLKKIFCDKSSKDRFKLRSEENKNGEKIPIQFIKNNTASIPHPIKMQPIKSTTLSPSPSGNGDTVEISIAKIETTEIKIEKYRSPLNHETPVPTLKISGTNDTTTRLIIQNSRMKTLDLSTLGEIEELSIERCPKLETILWPKNTIKKLKIMACDAYHTLDTSHIQNLENLYLRTSSIPTLENGSPSIKRLSLRGGNDSESLNLTLFPALEVFTFKGNDNAKELIANNLHMLKEVKYSNSCEVDQQLNFSYCANLTHFDTYVGRETNTTVDISHDTKLATLETRATIIGLESCPLLQRKQPQSHVPPTLTQRNEGSSTAVYGNKTKEVGFDSDTGKEENPYQATGNAKSTLFTDKPVDTDKQRIGVYTQVLGDAKGNITFSGKNEKLTPVTPKIHTTNPIKTWMEAATKNTPYTIGHYENTLEPEQSYPLTVSGLPLKDSLEIFSIPEDSLTFEWDETKDMFKVSLNKNFKQSTRIELFYRVKQNLSYDMPLPENHTVIKNKPSLFSPALLSRSFHNALEKELESQLELNNNTDLAFLFDKKLSSEEKIENLIRYFNPKEKDKAFKQEKLDKNKGPYDTDLERLCASVAQRCGVCRHRSKDFMVLAHYLNVPVRMDENEQHAFVEVPYIVNGKREWRRADLGGGSREDLTPADVRGRNIFQQLEKEIATEEKAAPSRRKKMTRQEELLEKYRKGFNQRVEENTLTHIDDLFVDDNAKSPLLKLNPGQSAFTVNHAMLTQLPNSTLFEKNHWNIRDHHIYIHSPEEFNVFLCPSIFENGEWQRENGPLHKLITEGGVLVINWSTFTPNQIATFKSTLDKRPTLGGFSITENGLEYVSHPLNNVKVINLIYENNAACSAFRTRCKDWQVSDDFLTAALPKKEAQEKETLVSEGTSTNQTITVDLFESSLWREKLFGKEIYENGKKVLKEGKLIKAIREKRPITIFNRPNDPDFDTLLHRLRDERKFLFLGTLYNIDEKTEITLEKRQNSTVSDKITFVDTSQIDPAHCIYLGMYNLHECRKRLVVEEDAPKYVEGFLKEADDNTVFYLSENIALSAWQQLVAHIDKHYRGRNFKFCLAPNVTIERVNLPKNDGAVSLTQFQHITFTNDTDYVSQALNQKNNHESLVIPVTPQTTFSELVYDIKKVKGEFIYTEHAFLKTLRDNKKVILNGELSPTLYAQLLPLLSEKPHFYLQKDNKVERVEINGQLKLVMPSGARTRLSIDEKANYKEKYFNFGTYKPLFSNDDQASLDAIERFYRFAKQLPHGSTGRPTAPVISYQRFNNMLKALRSENPFHKSNPIKSLFHYDYPRYSEDYAYLNVMAKLCFSGKLTKRREKLSLLIDALDEQGLEKKIKKNIWKILNCLDEDELTEILGEDFEASIKIVSGYPTISSEAFNKLQRILAPLSADKQTKQPQKPISRVQKQRDRLQHLLKDNDTSIIFLKGPAGVGKTHTVRHALGEVAKKHILYEGMQSITDFLEAASADHSNNLYILLLDELNLHLPGAIDFLKAINEKNPNEKTRTVHWQGKIYHLGDNVKIIGTGNPEDYPNRYYHEVLQHHAPTLYFDMPEEHYLKEQVITPLLPKGLTEAQPEEVMDTLLSAYHLIAQYNPYLPLSMRDLESLTRRFSLLFAENNNIQKALLWACVNEFAGSVTTYEKRQVFIHELENKIEVDLPAIATDCIDITTKHALPKEKMYIVDAIEQDLKIRQHIIDTHNPDGPPPFYKCAIILEGDSGTGKSTLLMDILEKNNLEYIQITAGDIGSHEALRNAYYEGKIFVVDEINLDPGLEKLLDQLLTGNDPEIKETGQEIKPKPGFMIFASQNPSYFKGRVPLSPALLNRSHFIYMDDFTQAERTAVAAHKNMEGPQMFEKAYVETQQKAPGITNMRTFYEELNEKALPTPKDPKGKEKDEGEGEEDNEEIISENDTALQPHQKKIATEIPVDIQAQKEKLKAIIDALQKNVENYLTRREDRIQKAKDTPESKRSTLASRIGFFSTDYQYMLENEKLATTLQTQLQETLGKVNDATSPTELNNFKTDLLDTLIKHKNTHNKNQTWLNWLFITTSALENNILNEGIITLAKYKPKS